MDHSAAKTTDTNVELVPIKQVSPIKEDTTATRQTIMIKKAIGNIDEDEN